MAIVFMSLDNGELYEDIDDEETQVPDYYIKYEIPNEFTLTAKQICGGYGNIVPILSNANLLKEIK